MKKVGEGLKFIIYSRSSSCRSFSQSLCRWKVLRYFGLPISTKCHNCHENPPFLPRIAAAHIWYICKSKSFLLEGCRADLVLLWRFGQDPVTNVLIWWIGKRLISFRRFLELNVTYDTTVTDPKAQTCQLKSSDKSASTSVDRMFYWMFM